jgi:lycopene cyclase domain-containing protein
MDYLSVLSFFLVPPLIVLIALVVRRMPSAGYLPYAAVLAMVLIAVAYTTPWDNYLVATKVWWYDEALVVGLTLGWVPVEEYLFFILQALLTGFWTVFLMHTGSPPPPSTRREVRVQATLAAVALWLLAAGLGASGWRPGTYLWLILVWALIPLAIQLAYGADILAGYRRVLFPAIAAPTVYLWLVDFLAIRSGTWTLDLAQTLGIALGGVLAVEEMVFFLATNLLISFGIILILAPASQQRASTILARIRDTL